MTHLTAELGQTICANWYSAEFRERDSRRGSTRRRYYQALRSCLPDDGAAGDRLRLDRNTVATAAGSRGPSTLYLLFGAHSESLVAAVSGQPYLGSRRSGPVADLITEAKVVSFWPYREAWLLGLVALGREDRRFAAETLIRVLAEWSVAERPLAAVDGFAPPLSVMEDLWLAGPDEPWSAAITAVLTRVIELAHRLPGISPLGTLNAVHDELMALGFGRGVPEVELVDELTESLAAIEYLIPRLSRQDRTAFADQLVPQLSSVLTLFGRQP